MLKIDELSDLRASVCFWNAPTPPHARLYSKSNNGNSCALKSYIANVTKMISDIEWNRSHFFH